MVDRPRAGWRLARALSSLRGRARSSRLRHIHHPRSKEDAADAHAQRKRPAHQAPELRQTDSGKAVTTVSVASGRRDRHADPIYIDLVLWDVQAAFAAKHLVKGQAVAFAGRLEPRTWETRAGEQRVALEIHGVELEYGAKPRGAEPTADTETGEDGPF